MRVGLHLACYPELAPTWNYLPPLGLGYLASYARKRVDGLEFAIERDLEALIAARPDLVGLTFGTHHALYAQRAARQIKEELGIPVFCGGPHVSTLPTVLDEGFDFGVLHEGEETFAELMRLYQAERRFDPRSLAKIPGLLYRDGDGRLARTEPRPHIADLDTIPYPDRAAMHEKWKRPISEATLMSSRGCPYNCRFCSTVQHWGRDYRCFSDDYVLGEIESIRRQFDPQILHFYDDLFIVRKDRTLRLLEGIRRRRLHEGLDLRCFVRSNLVDDELCEAFTKTNFRILYIGFESASDAVLETFNKQAVAMDRQQQAIDLARKHGIRYASTFILGAPGETRDDIISSFEFVSANLDVFHYVQFHPLVVLPGTEVWEWAKRVGVTDANLEGVAFEPADVADERDYYLKRWPFLNEANMSREELYSYFLAAQKIEALVWGHTQTRETLEQARRELDQARGEARTARSPEYVAANTPILSIVREKARRRLRQILDHGASK